jgi:hypothetical protein
MGGRGAHPQESYEQRETGEQQTAFDGHILEYILDFARRKGAAAGFIKNLPPVYSRFTAIR